MENCRRFVKCKTRSQPASWPPNVQLCLSYHTPDCTKQKPKETYSFEVFHCFKHDTGPKYKKNKL